jgi:hypothetical protein
MIVHIVLGRAREDLSGDEQQELAEALEALRNVPGVASMSWGANFSERSKGYTHGAVIHFEDREALGVYQQHEKHRAIVQTLDRLMPERLVLDYETWNSGIEG